ncbi:MAG: response regulator [Rubrobacter sp.]|nr:response regulator [Rubrobacter sp.]
MQLDGTKIMVADDDRVVRRIVSVKLSGLGCEVSEAEDGQQALEKLGEDPPPDLLITDSLMPRVNGMQLVRNVRDSERLSRLPVIMLTARQGEQDIIEGLEAGLDDYVVKPFSPDELAARVRTVLWRTSRG